MLGDLTRRELTAGLLASTTLSAQTDAESTAAVSGDARELLRTAASEMREVDLDLNTQPAFVFRP